MILIKNGKIYTMAGQVIENGSILIKDGKIAEIAEHIAAPAEAEVIDAAGRMVMPGMIDAHCHLGMWESSIRFEGDDVNEMTSPVTAQLRAIDGLNPMDRTFHEARDGGVTTACTGPGSANVIGGTFVAVKTHGDRIDDMVVKNPVAMKAAFGENPKRVYNAQKKLPTTRMGTAAVIREALMKAKRYLAAIEQAGDDASKLPPLDMQSEALLPVLRKEIPLKAHAHRADDIFTSIRIAREFDINITLDHCTEGHLIVDHLVKEGLPAIVGPSFGHRTKFELTNKDFVTPGVLARAGLKVAITTDSPVTPLESLPLMAGMAVAAGMDEMDALKAITTNPAEIMGIADRVGSLEVGKDADVVIYDGHPFEISGKTWKVLIDGAVVFSRE
ncbi:MAG: amidohydrolase [Firmicutes bacterium]|nr:amidohydrolase [Bacillota bacterium]